MKLKQIAIVFISGLLVVACHITKYVPDGKSLLNNTKIKQNETGIETSDLKGYILQKPNTYWLGLVRVRLGLYSLSRKDREKGNSFLKKIGEEPVIFDSIVTENSKNSINQAIINKGYLNSKVDLDIVTKKKKTNLTFIINKGRQYKIRYFNFDINNDSIFALLKSRYAINSFEGEPFDVDKLNELRNNITQMLRRRGYYNVQKDAFMFVADTVQLKGQVDIKLQPKEEYSHDSISNVLFRQKTINKITIYCIAENELKKTVKYDTIQYNGYTIIYNDNKHIFTPQFLTSKILIAENQLYNERTVERTTSNLSNLQAIKYVNINFIGTDSVSLDCVVYLSPSEQYSYSVQVDGTTNAAFNNAGSSFGARMNLGYIDKNIFHGGETFKLGTFASYDFYRDSIRGVYNAFSFGGEASLSLPKLLVPLVKDDARLRFGASTAFSVNYTFQQHPLYARSIATATMGYKWQQRRNTMYNFHLIDLSYINMSKADPLLFTLLPNMRHSFEDHLVLKMGLNYSTSNMSSNLAAQNYYSFRSSIQSGGNLFFFIDKAGKAFGKDNLMNFPYYQFVKGDFDYSYNVYVNNRIRLILHTMLGIGLPYGKASVLPFEERYFAGGQNSMRGWAARQLGPGSFSNDSTNFLLRNGDIKFEMNAEVRFKLFWIIEGAAFMDAGNVWTIKKYQDQTNGVFSFKNGKFFREIAVNYGVGLRFNFSFFIFRFDLGIKLYEPGLPAGNRWYISENPLLNSVLEPQFAIGYPF
jgi:outer membrane protein assembly factor BamA